MRVLKSWLARVFPPRYSYEQVVRAFMAGQQTGFLEGYEAGKAAKLAETASQALERIFGAKP